MIVDTSSVLATSGQALHQEQCMHTDKCTLLLPPASMEMGHSILTAWCSLLQQTVSGSARCVLRWRKSALSHLGNASPTLQSPAP